MAFSSSHCYLVIVVLAISSTAVWSADSNLTCYQCQRNNTEECGQESLKSCPSNKDRCVVTITKDPKNGVMTKRECGLGPCGFEDDMVNRGLGLEGCDRSKDEYSCFFCCKLSGCNKSSGSDLSPSQWLITLILLSMGIGDIALVSKYVILLRQYN